MKTLVAMIALLLHVNFALAHDFWIEPSSFQPAVDTTLKIHLRVGDIFPGDLVPRNDQRIERFIVAGPGDEGERTIAGSDGAEPAGVLRVAKPGLLILGYRSKPSSVTLEPAKFERYLKDKGLDHVLAFRQQKNEHTKEAREIFSRCARALVQVGAFDDQAADHALGFRLELIAQKNPYALKPGDELPLRLLFENKPAGERLVIARNGSHPDAVAISGRTDADGRVPLRLPTEGMWLINAVHMVPAPQAPVTESAEWESLWASLTFELRGRAETERANK